jgi:hypothetical protein
MAISLERFSPTASDFSHDLRLLYQLFEEAQRSRVAHGERLRAIFQGRTVAGGEGRSEDADALLKTIARGNTVGAPRVLERAYARAAGDEVDAADTLREVVALHPAWPWLSSKKGVGHLLAARLLSRLDVTRARTPSAFWAYCGLATIPGVAYRCERCRLEVAYPVGYKLHEPHYSRSGLRECTGHLELLGADQSTRVAPRRSTLGGRKSYDSHARKSCYLIGVSLLRCGSDYRSFYDSERTRLATLHVGWTPRHSHLAALRRMEKAFLRDLWLAWRRAVNLPVVPSYFPRL